MSKYPASYPRDETGRPWPADANAVLEWLKTASDAELDWYYRAYR